MAASLYDQTLREGSWSHGQQWHRLVGLDSRLDLALLEDRTTAHEAGSALAAAMTTGSSDVPPAVAARSGDLLRFLACFGLRRPWGRAIPAAMLALAALVASARPILAQADDEALIRKVRVSIADVLNQTLESRRSDRPFAWSDPSGALSGVVTVYAPIMRDSQPCRSFKYVVHDVSEEVTDTGLYCRDPAGLWSSAGVPDIVATRLLEPTAAQPDPLVASLQRNFIRLAYDGGPADGLRQPRFEMALQQFESDEGLPQGSDPDAIRRALAQTASAIARASRGGICDRPAGSEDSTLVCGRRRAS